MTFTKIDPADLDSPRRELFIRGLTIVVALLVCWQINFLSARIGRPMQNESRDDFGVDKNDYARGLTQHVTYQIKENFLTNLE